MQRVAIARALINRPVLLLADEPTGNLDSTMGQNIISLFRELNHEGLTIVTVTLNTEVADAAGRELSMLDGHLVSDTAMPGIPPVELIRSGLLHWVNFSYA